MCHPRAGKTEIQTNTKMSHKIPSNRDLVVFALSMMGSITDRFHTEAIAIRCHELFPTSFSWTTRPDLPDKDVVRIALTDARKEKFGALVEGRSGQGKGQYQWTQRAPMLDGWSLTEAGFTWIEANRARFDTLLKASQGRGVFPKDHRQKSRKKLKWVLDHALFAEFRRGGDVFNPGIGKLADLARCRVDAEPSVWCRRLENVKRLGLETQQPDVVEFIEACIEVYENARKKE